MRRYAVTGLVALVTTTLGCGPDHGPPRVRALPRPDGLPALRGASPQDARSTRIANYKIDAHLDVARHVITATQTLTWTNTGQSQVDALPFHLYLNGFKNERSVFMQSARGTVEVGRQLTIPIDGGWGWISVDKITINGAATTAWKAIGPDESVAELALTQPVMPGATVEIGMAFTAQLPQVVARTGYHDEFHLVGQWFPKIGVRVGPAGAERWECRPFHVNNEFFADFGTYDVTITVPSTYVVAATGVLASASEAAGGTRSFTYRAEDVHDFAWMADPYMEVMSRPAKVDAAGNTVEVRVLYRPEQRHYATRHLEAAVGTIERFSTWFVPYPWPIMTIIDPPVEAADGAGGMEYPTFVTTAGDTVFARRGLRLPEYVTVHEVGHNWFQGILASNEVEEPWLDEGVNEWADAKVMADLYDARSSGVDWMGWQADYAALRMAIDRQTGVVPSPIATAAFAFVDRTAYGEATYIETMRALRTLEAYVGGARFADAMKTYAQTWAFKHPTGRDLFDSLSSSLGEDLAWFFGPVFHEVGGQKLEIRSTACTEVHAPRGVFDQKVVTSREAPTTGGYTCEIVVASTGVVHVPVDIELRFVDGSSQRLRWDDRGAGHWQRFTVERSALLDEVVLDPDGKIALGTPVERRYRLAGDGSAAMRGASWFASATQTILQIVGP
ncbi:MAG: M1 family metallopeptidase [Proteobacteria bacterium]|nr:M1 family metallopeptidase [Pseudomonadota bacterium]